MVSRSTFDVRAQRVERVERAERGGWGGCDGAWRTLGGVGPLPKLKTLAVLVEEYPELGGLVKLHGPAVPERHPDHQLPARTQSEEEEHQHQRSVELMRQEQMQNDILLDTLKRIQGSSAGSLHESEIGLLRAVIEQKQMFINKLHAEGIELVQQIEDWRMRLRDEEDRSSAERERVLHTSQAVEAAIEDITQDKQLAVQRLGQYQLLYTRTVDDRNHAESRMLRARELVSMGREDVLTLGECLLQTKAVEEKYEKELSATLAWLESSRATWKSSLEQRTRDIDGIIRRYEEAKNERLQEEEASARHRAEAERVRREMERREIEHAERLRMDLERSNALLVEQWRVVCTAAGVEEGSGADAVIAAYEACRQPTVSLSTGTEAAMSTRSDGDGADDANDESHAMVNVETHAEINTNGTYPKLAAQSRGEEASSGDVQVEELRQSAVGVPWGEAGCEPGADPSVTESGPLKYDELAFLAYLVGQNRLPCMQKSVFEVPLQVGQKEAHEGADVATVSRVLSRHEIKARSRKTKARLDKTL